MCTLSITRRDGAIHITVNRDERLDRGAEIAPHIWQNGMIAPQDSLSAGTWIGAHPKTGHWACLLNGYSATDTPRKKSRGAIIPLLLSGGTPFDLSEIEVADYNSFRLIYGDQEHIHEAFWDGQALHLTTPELTSNWLFRSSSSWEQNAVFKHRTDVFENWCKGADQDYIKNTFIPSFHALQAQGQESSSILMRRSAPERATTSITVITLADKGVEMHYLSSQAPDAKTLCALNLKDISDENKKTLAA